MTITTTNKVAIVTGASSGIGRATAERLAKTGYDLVLVARRKDRLETLATNLRAMGRTVSVVDGDLANRETADDAVAAAINVSGRLDVVVNAAGLMLIGDSVQQPTDEWERMIDVNLRGLMHLTKAALPQLLVTAKNHGGPTDVVNISSVAGRVIAANTALYTATKFAVTAATDAWRQEYAGTGLRFSAVEPGFVDTELGSFQEGTQAFYDHMASEHEILHPDDIASAIEYIVTRPARVAINELLIRPSHQQ
jgi:NADP-dependent 3-hydroxy acid dehydrogenase YdfG